METKIKYSKKACACAVSLDLLGDRWTLIIIRDLFNGKCTFSEFLNNSSEGIATNILTNRLKKLLYLNIIDFKRKASDRKVKEYFLTNKGIDLYPVIFELQSWSLKHVEFEQRERTQRFVRLNKNETSDKVKSIYIDNYKNLRLKKFGF
ncbi:MAG: winged helix-turn-helix transcriptional regulator [Flavobacteriaceae bacterium]